jgi:hypothetical protein
MATGYSGTPLINKLGIKQGMKVLLLNQPANYDELLEKNIGDQLVKKNNIPDVAVEASYQQKSSYRYLGFLV